MLIENPTFVPVTKPEAHTHTKSQTQQSGIRGQVQNILFLRFVNFPTVQPKYQVECDTKISNRNKSCLTFFGVYK